VTPPRQSRSGSRFRFHADVLALAAALAGFAWVAYAALGTDLLPPARAVLTCAFGAGGGLAHRLAARSLGGRERIGYAAALAAAGAGAVLFGSAALAGTPTDPAQAGPLVRTVGAVAFAALATATLAAALLALGRIRAGRETAEERAERIREEVVGRSRR
jgi:Zn-dependent protease